jgi:transmembrane sensor
MADEPRELLLKAMVEPVDEARLLHNLQAVRRRQVQRKVRRARVGASGASLAACALVLWLARGSWLPASPQPGPLHASTASGTYGEHALGLERLRAKPAQAAAGAVSLDDGSRIHLAAESRLELVENSGERVRSVLHEGWARFEVEPGGPRRWIVDAGLAEVQVVGTAFTVSHRGSETRVRVHHGRVLVRSALVASGLVQLGSGEQLRLRGEPATPPRPAPGRPVELTSPEPAAQAVAPAVAASTAAPAASALPLAAHPAPAPASAAVTLRSALEQADALRAAGQPQRAAQVLTRELWAHPGVEGVGITALTLGQIQLDQLQQPAQAARSFALAYQASGLPPALREQALARQVEALAKAGQPSQARARADDYARHYPAGGFLPALRRWLDGAE